MDFFFPRNRSLDSITFWCGQKLLLKFAKQDLAFKKYIVLIIFSQISPETNAIVSSSKHFFLLKLAHHLVDLNTPFWIEIKTNEETVSWCTAHAYSYFLPLSMFIWSSYFVHQSRFSEAGSCVKMTLSHFKPSENSRLLIYLLVFTFDRTSLRRLRRELMARRETSKSIPISSSRGLFYSLKMVKLLLKSNII